jgi:hypothetical protein
MMMKVRMKIMIEDAHQMYPMQRHKERRALYTKASTKTSRGPKREWNQIDEISQACDDAD